MSYPGLISDYLDFRAARGFQPNRKIEHLLTQFANTLPAERHDGLLFSQGEALAWAHARRGGTRHGGRPVVRRQRVRGLSRRVRPAGRRARRPARRQRLPAGDAISVSLNADIQAVMTTAQQLFTPLRAATMTTLVGLIAVTGMRIGETVRLTVGDLDLDQGVVLIAHAKFGRQRMVRLEPSSCQALADYLSVPVRRRFGTDPKVPCSSPERHRGQRAHRHGAHFTR